MKWPRAAAFATVFVAAVAFAQSRLPERRLSVSATAGSVRATFSALDLANVRVRQALGSGLQKQFATTVQLYRVGSSTPVATRSLSCRVVYDLWEEAFIVRRGRRTEVVRGVDAALERCLVVSNAEVARSPELASMHGSEAFLAVRAEFNPISASACARSLRRPDVDDPLGPVVVNIVRREICQADRSIEFRSQAFRVP